MPKANRFHLIISTVLFTMLCAVSTDAAEAKGKKEQPFTPGGQWRRHDMNRPRPKVVDPGFFNDNDAKRKAPADAIVLFDGKDLSQWVRNPRKDDKDRSEQPKWKIENDYIEIVAKSGSISTKQKFGDCHIHIEWATPAQVDPAKKGQSRGNSGVYLPGHNEVQVLDSYENETYADGQAAAIYGMYPPLVNACRKPGEWQTYDITLEQPRYDAERKLVRPCRVTVVHNGIVVQDRVDLGGGPTEGVILLQDHLNPVRYRNIWVRKLKPEELK